LARTREVTRAIVEVRSNVPGVTVKCTIPETDVEGTGKRPPPLTLKLFLDELRRNAGAEVATLAEQTIKEAPSHGLQVDFGSAGAMFKFEDEDSSEYFNFGQIMKNGILRSGRLSQKCVIRKMPTSIWKDYYDALVRLIPGSKRCPWNEQSTGGIMAYVGDAAGNELSAVPLLRNRKQWFKAIKAAVERIRPLLAKSSYYST